MIRSIWYCLNIFYEIESADSFTPPCLVAKFFSATGRQTDNPIKKTPLDHKIEWLTHDALKLRLMLVSMHNNHIFVNFWILEK